MTLISGYFRDRDNPATTAMDVGQLGGHIFSGYQIAGVWSALTAACRLRLNNNPEALGGGVDRAAEGSAPIEANSRRGPAARQSLGTE